MSTPRTDAVGTNGGYYRNKKNGWYIPIEFVRQLETELIELSKAASTACGDLAENAALDLDHYGKFHRKWYRAVKKVRKLLKTAPQPAGEASTTEGGR